MLCSSYADAAEVQGASSTGEEGRPVKVAVPDMIADNVDAALARNLTEVLTAEANRIAGLDVISMADIQALLGLEEKKQILGCDDVSCLAEIGGALGADVILSSRIGKVGDTYVISVRAFDAGAARVINSAIENVTGEPDALLVAARRATLAALTEVGTGGAAKVQEEPLVWPAWALIGLGSTATVVGLGLGVASLYSYRHDLQKVEVSGLDHRYIPVGGQDGFMWARGLGISALSTSAGGLAAVSAGVGWLLLADRDAQEAGREP